MLLLNSPVFSIAALFLSVLCVILFFILSIKHKEKITILVSQFQAQELILNNIQRLNEKFHVDIDTLQKKYEQTKTDNIQISKQLEHRIKTLQIQIDKQNETISQIQTDQGDDKFYTRAIKLAKKGADINEIVTECELPYAEVEMLISVYQKKNIS
jgi:hypothetical protein